VIDEQLAMDTATGAGDGAVPVSSEDAAAMGLSLSELLDLRRSELADVREQLAAAEQALGAAREAGEPLGTPGRLVGELKFQLTQVHQPEVARLEAELAAEAEARRIAAAAAMAAEEERQRSAALVEARRLWQAAPAAFVKMLDEVVDMFRVTGQLDLARAWEGRSKLDEMAAAAQVSTMAVGEHLRDRGIGWWLLWWALGESWFATARAMADLADPMTPDEVVARRTEAEVGFVQEEVGRRQRAIAEDHRQRQVEASARLAAAAREAETTATAPPRVERAWLSGVDV
jgi:hypothetical protein